MKSASVTVMVTLALASCRPASDAPPPQITRAAPEDVAGYKAGQSVPIKAIVARVTGGAAWNHETDGGFAVFDAITFKITDPPELDGRELTVYFVPHRLPENAPLRTPGIRCTFRIDAQHLRPPEPNESREIHEGALEGLTVLSGDQG
ncbi:MAG TPA: hypothetical protein VML55_15765 [Planctomycetaceae bacterium]|nr:hypothetical protein [Planctomycetaceae bacterium]